MNSFALVLKDTKHAALLMELPTQVVDDDGHGQRGSEVPVFDQSALNNHTLERVFRAKKRRGTMDIFHIGLVRIHILRGMAYLGASTTATKTYQGHKRSPPPVFDRPIPGTAPSTLGFPLHTRLGRLTGAHPTAIPPNPFSAPPPRTRKREGLAGSGRSGGGADHPLRAIWVLVDEALAALSGDFAVLYSTTGRPSIAPEKPGRFCCPSG